MDRVAAFSDWLTWDHAVLTVLSVSTLIFVCDATGLLPSSWSRWINRNQIARTIEVLQRLGIDVPRVRQRNAAAGVTVYVQGRTLEERVRKRLDGVSMKGQFNIGSTRRLPTDSFVDAMGACTDPASAEVLAADLYAHWGNLLRDPSSRVEVDVEFIVTPKSGSPLLGYEFAKLMRKPFTLFNSSPKFDGLRHQFKADFDCAAIPPRGSRALLVDDSSTGGAKACAAVLALRNAGYVVSDFLVLFEPLLKEPDGANAASRLSQLDVSLRSIIRG